MNTTEHTDLDGDALAIHRDKGLAWVTITRDGDELTVGPVPAQVLAEQPLDGCDLEGEMLRVVAEQEAVIARAVKAEKERNQVQVNLAKTTEQLHDALDEQVKLIKERDEARNIKVTANVVPMSAGEPCPLTPADLDDAAMARAVAAWEETGELRPAIEAALTVPTRPEGAEEIEAILAGSWPMDREGLSAAADDLAMNGVRVEGSGR